MSLKIIEGNILDITEGVICHQTNTLGIMGGGLALQIKEKWPNIYRTYHNICTDYPDFLLGQCWVDNVGVDGDYTLNVAHLMGQSTIGEGKQTNYGALASALANLCQFSYRGQPYFPYGMGCGLGGADWKVVSEMIEFFIPKAIIVRYTPDDGYLRSDEPGE